MATTEVEDVQNNISVLNAVLSTCAPGDPEIPYYQAILFDMRSKLGQVQPKNAYASSMASSVTPHTISEHSYQDPSASASRKRSLGVAEIPEAKRVSANPSPTNPSTPDSFPALPGTQQQRALPSRPNQLHIPTVQPHFLDLTHTETPNHHQNDPFPELNDAFRNDNARPSLADAFNQEWLSETQLASFLMTPDLTYHGYGFPQQRVQPQNLASPMTIHQGGMVAFPDSSMTQVPYLPGHRFPERQIFDSDDEEDYGDFPLNAIEAESIEAMLESVHQNGHDDIFEDREQTPRIMKSQLKEYQKIGLTWLLKMEDGRSKGGILADEMGLGKTVSRQTNFLFLCSLFVFRILQTLETTKYRRTNTSKVQALALICARPSQDSLCKTTLIIAPVALLRQWEKEIAHHVLPRHKLSVYMYWGAGKKADFNKLRTYDVVLTTFGTLTSEYKQKDSRVETFSNEDGTSKPSPSHKGKYKLALLGRECMWYRIIMDEAHNIKNRNSKVSKASTDLQARHRLCMTGTP